MRAFLAIARREIDEKRFVFAAAVAASLVPFLVSMSRGLHGPPAREAQQWTAAILATVFGVGLAVALGVSMLAKEIANRQIGFYFSRPVPGFVLWMAKLVAAFVITMAACFVIVLPSFLPSVISGSPTALSAELPPFSPLSVFGAVLVILVLLHAGTIAVRSHSVLLVLDLLALLAAMSILFLGVRRLVLIYGAGAARLGLFGVAVVAFGAVAAGGAVAVTRGRTEIRAAHARQSAVLWCVIGLGVISFLAFGEWVRSAKPSDVGTINAARSLGRWTAVKGWARGAIATFLIDADARHSHRAILLWEWPRLSPNAAIAGWLEKDLAGGFEFVTLRLTGQSAEPLRKKLLLPADPHLMAISANGDQLVIFTLGTMTVLEASTGRSISSAHLPDGARPLASRFVGDAKVRAYISLGRGEPQIEIVDFDAAAKILTTLGRIGGIRDRDMVVVSPSGKLLLVMESWGGDPLLVDGESGAFLQDLSSREQTFGRRVGFLSDDRIVVSSSGSHPKLTVLSSKGEIEKTIEFPTSAPAFVALNGEISPGHVTLSLAYQGRNEVFLVDVDTGRYQKVGEGLDSRVTDWWFAQDGDPLPLGEGAKLFLDHGSLVHFDPLTGERRVILAKAANRW
jgi:hypothetical protein